jgi:hypothetical protein
MEAVFAVLNTVVADLRISEWHGLEVGVRKVFELEGMNSEVGG